MQKVATGIKGFDALSAGGLPYKRLSLLLGGAGSGKTIFALQTALQGAKEGQSTIFVCFEEDKETLIENANSFSWDISAVIDESLHVIEARIPIDIHRSGAFDLGGLLATIEATIKATGATRVIFDAVDAIIALLNDAIAERVEFIRIQEWLRKNKLTGLITAKADSDSFHLLPPSYSFLNFMADCVISLDHRFIDRTSSRSLRIQKYRGSPHVADEFPMLITQAGLVVSYFTSMRLEYPISMERISTGIARLDRMMGGGYYRGSSILASGAPGSAKTTLAGAFAEAAYKRNERVLFISFDESSDQIIRNLKSVGIDLGAAKASGLLKMASFRTGSVSGEEHLLAMTTMVEEFNPDNVVVDPVSAISNVAGQLRAVSIVLRLLDYAKHRGVTAFLTSLLDSSEDQSEITRSDVSTMADTWMHLSFSIRGGERNRALTIIKSRGMQHSNQVRELILSESGPTLADVYIAGGEVLMGTARVEKEIENERLAQERASELESRKSQLKEEEAYLKLKVAETETKLAARRSELSRLEAEELMRKEQGQEERQKILAQRFADSAQEN